MVTYRLLSREIDRWRAEWFKADDDGLKRFDRLLATREREGRALIAAARSLRVAKSSQMRSEAAGRAATKLSSTGRRPWDPV